MIHARLDRKTQKHVLCGAHRGQCRGEFGTLLWEHGYQAPLMLRRDFSQLEYAARSIERCPVCNSENVIELAVLVPPELTATQ